MSQTTSATESWENLGKASTTFWKAIKADVARSLWTTFTEKPVREGTHRDTVIKNLQQANVSISWARVGSWLRNQARDPGETPAPGVEPRDWAFDRAFYLTCRADKINVQNLLKMKGIGLRNHMTNGTENVASTDRNRRAEALAKNRAGSQSNIEGSALPSATSGAGALNGSAKAQVLDPIAQRREPATGASTPALQLGEPPEHESTSPAIAPVRDGASSQISKDSGAQSGGSDAAAKSNAPAPAGGAARPEQPSRNTSPSPVGAPPDENLAHEPTSSGRNTSVEAAIDPPLPQSSSRNAPSANASSQQSTALREGSAVDSPLAEGAPAPPRDTVTRAPAAVSTDFLPRPPANTDQTEYRHALLMVLAKTQFKDADENIVHFKRLPASNSSRLWTRALVAVIGRDPRPTSSSQDGTDFIFIMQLVVRYLPVAQLIYARSEDILELVAEDPRFRGCTMLVTAPDGTGNDYSLGWFGPTTRWPSPGMRIPLDLANPSSLLVTLQSVRLGVTVKLELTVDDDDEGDHSQVGSTGESPASAPQPKPTASSRASAQPSKGKGRASARPTPAASQTARPAGRKDPRRPENENEEYLVAYIGEALDATGKPWEDNATVHEFRREELRGRICASRLIAGIHVISHLLHLTVTDPQAPKHLAGKDVPQKAVAIFLNVKDNWLSQCKRLVGLLQVFKGDEKLEKYLESIKDVSVGLVAILRAVERLTSEESTTEERVLPKKRRRIAATSDENEAGPSNFQEDYDGAPREYIDHDEEDEEGGEQQQDEYEDEDEDEDEEESGE